MPVSDKWSQYEAKSPAAKPDKWSQYEAAPASTASLPAPDLTTNTVNPATGTGYGLYRMGSYDFNAGQVSKPEIQVPYNRVQDAIAAGYKLHPDEAPRYQQDTAHSGSVSRATGQVKSLLARMTETMPDTPLEGNWWQKANAAAGNIEKLPFNVVNRTLRGLAGLPAGLVQTATGISHGDPTALESVDPATMAENSYKGMQQDTSDLGPVAALGNLGGDAATLYLTGKYGPKAVESATQPMLDVVRGVKNLPESFARAVTDTGTGPIKDLVKKTVAENERIDAINQDRIEKQRTDQIKADADHRGDLLKLRQKYEQDVRDATEKARTGTAEDRAKVQSKNLAAKQKYEQDVRDAQQKYENKKAETTQSNTKASADYQGKLLKIRQEYEQQVRDAGQKFSGNKAAIEQANAEARRQYNRKIGEAAQQNRAATAAERAKIDQEGKLQVGGSQLIYGLRQLDKALRDRANQMYGVVREKMAGASLPSDALADIVRAAQEKWIRGSPEKIKEFNAMLSTGSPGPELTLADQTAQNMGYKDFRTAITNPAIRSTLSRALPPDVWEAAIGQGTRPISWNDLQGFYEETGARIADGPQPGKADIFKALQQAHDEIGNQMSQLSKTRGADKEFDAARKFYREYMDTFHEPTGPSGSGSPVAQALRAKDPAVAVDKFAGDAGDRGIAVLRRYSDSLANLAQNVRRTAQEKVTVPARKSAVDIPVPKIKQVPAGANFPLPPVIPDAPVPTSMPAGANLPLPGVVEPPPAARATNLPLPPVLPEPETVPVELKPHQTISSPDLAAARRAAYESRLNKIESRGYWAATWPLFQAARALWGGHIPSIPTMGLESAGMLATIKATTHLLNYPPMMDFLTKARPEDLASIPPDLRGDLPGLVTLAQRQGIKVAPALVAAVAGSSQQVRQPVAQGAIQ